jgi:hypothetical protein
MGAMMWQNYRVLFLDSTSKIVLETYIRSDGLLNATLWATSVVPFPATATVIEVSAEEANAEHPTMTEISGGESVGRVSVEREP